MTGRPVIATVGIVLGFAVVFAAGVALAVGGAPLVVVLVVLLGVCLILVGARSRPEGRQRAAEAGRRAEVLAWWHDEQRRGRGRGA
jgi:membrane protein implicated in regulation of membrane protease activity